MMYLKPKTYLKKQKCKISGYEILNHNNDINASIRIIKIDYINYLSSLGLMRSREIRITSTKVRVFHKILSD